MRALAQHRLYHFKSAEGDAELINAIKGLLNPTEHKDLVDIQSRDPNEMIIPAVLFTESSKPLVIDLGEKEIRSTEYQDIPAYYKGPDGAKYSVGTPDIPPGSILIKAQRVGYETKRKVRLTKEYGPAVSRGKTISSSVFIRTYLYFPEATEGRPTRLLRGEYGYKLYAIWCKLMELTGYKKPSYGYFRLLIYRLRRLGLIELLRHEEWKPGTERSTPWPVDNKNYYGITKFGMNDETLPIWRNPQYALYEKPKGIMDIYKKYGVKVDWPS